MHLPRVGPQRSNPFWTLGGGVMVAWNAVNWRRPERHLSRLARKHPLVTIGVMGGYLYHFLGPVRKGLEEMGEG